MARVTKAFSLVVALLTVVAQVTITGVVTAMASEGGSRALASPESQAPPCTDAPPMVACPVDCSANAEVSIDELITGVTIALGLQPVDRCTHADIDGNGEVTVNELVQGVSMLLDGCPIPEGALYEARACEQPFRVWVQNPGVIAEAERILRGATPQKIIVGELRCGHGNFNGPWHWHLDPRTVEFAEVAMELCDGCPDFVERDLSYWLETVRRYCPWSTQLVRRVR